MLSDFLHTLVQFIEFLWPFRIVHQWERGLYSVFGKIKTPWRWVALSRTPLDGHVLPAGLYLTFPWFTDVKIATTTWDYVDSGRLDIVLKDGRILSCEAVAKMRIVDLERAFLDFNDYEKDRKGMLRAVIAETLSEADDERFQPERRGRLLGTSMLKAVQREAAALGHEVESVQLTAFILNPKTLRLLNDSPITH